MAIDMAALKAATFGDQEGSLTVKRKWLKEVHCLLEQAERDKIELANLKARIQYMQDTESQKSSHKSAPFNKMDAMFGRGGMFGGIFGKDI